ncbi:MAG: hypothetical protein M1819_003801 [Sarea resinae]|nr:MAG: hypothetical protein M1819_003801 [Sarea resinae]
MPRSAADATRFTATGPHANSKSGISSSTAPPSKESPQDKVARLRRAAQQARLDKEPRFERVLARGRVWADRAHRITALSLIGLTGVAGVVTVFALGDMIALNRRKRREFFAEEEKKHQFFLAAAQDAFAKGIADEDQIVLLNRERAAAEAEAEKKKGIFTRAKGFLVGGLKKDEDESVPAQEDQQQQGGESLVASTASAIGGDVWKQGGSESTGETGDKVGVLKALDERRRGAERQLQTKTPQGGYLDQLGENVATKAAETSEKASSSSRSWTSWLTGR